MSKSKHKSDFTILAILGVIALTVIFVLVYGESMPNKASQQIGYRTTYSTNIEGMKVYYTLLEQLNYDVRRREVPFFPENLSQLDILWVIDPIIALEDHELSALHNWVNEGGVLICNAFLSSRMFRLYAPSEEAEEQKTFYLPPSISSIQPGRDGTIPELYEDYPLARDVVRVVFKRAQATLDPNDEIFSDDLGTPEVLLHDDTGPRITTRRVGTGLIIALADSSFLSNGGIGLADNAILTINLIAYAQHYSRGMSIAFDEYHFGYGHRETGWTILASMLWRSSGGWAVLSLTLAGIFFLIYKGRRFGRRYVLVQVRRRSKLEYVYSVGATYRAAGAHHLAFKINYHWLRNKAAEMVGLPAICSAAELAEKLAQWADVPPQKYQDIFEICDQALAQSGLSSRRASWLISKLAQIESEVFHGPKRRQ